MKVIFLDIDGVMIKYGEKKTYRDFDSDLTVNLAYILVKTDAKIVISSSWRHHMDEVKGLFDRAHLPWDRVIGKTPNLKKGGSRSMEILLWLDVHYDSSNDGDDITHWCAIDDEYGDMQILRSLGKLVKTDMCEGLTKEKAEEAILLLTS